jgi:hypothetical protein
MITYSNGAPLVLVPLQLQCACCHEDDGANEDMGADGNYAELILNINATFGDAAGAFESDE